MSLQKQLIKEGNKTDYPKTDDTVTIEYTGWLYDPSAANNRGTKSVSSISLFGKATLTNVLRNRFDSSVGRGDFSTKIGVGRVIQGEHARSFCGPDQILTV
jgi:FK506-binding protein 1